MFKKQKPVENTPETESLAVSEHPFDVQKRVESVAVHMVIHPYEVTLSDQDCMRLDLPKKPSMGNYLEYHQWLYRVEAILKIRKARAFIEQMDLSK